MERHQNLFHGRLINLALEFDTRYTLTTGENRSKGKIGRNLTLYYTTITIMQGYRRSRKEFSWSRCTVADNVEFSLIKVTVRYIQYIAYTVLIEMMQIVKEDLYTWP